MTGPRRPCLGADLVVRVARQRAVRHGVDADAPTIEQAALIHAVDEENVRWFAVLVATAGWPGRRLVGAEGANAALVLAERAPAPYRAAWLPKARSAARHRDASHPAVEMLAAQVEADRRTESVR
jgi:hypothetical protein